MTKVFLFALFVMPIAPCLASSQDDAQFHCIDPKTPEGLRELFCYDDTAIPLLSAHRGGAVPGYPENCIATFEHTVRHAFSILEIDLQYTKDGQLVLHHDATLERTTTGTGRVADRTLQELKELRLKDNDGNVTQYCMPTLDEALQWARGKTIVILDKKAVPVEVCVKKIQEHRAQAYAMVMAYSFQDIQACHKLDPGIMMEVMIGDHQRFRGFDESGVPWNRIVAFVGHEPPKDKQLVEKIHAKGACCMAGTSRNLDRQLRVAGEEDRNALQREYRSRLDFGVDLIETDLPIQVGNLLYKPRKIPAAKSSYFHLPHESQCSRMEMVRVADSGKEFTLDRSGKRFIPWGFNYIGDFGRIVEEYWEADWPRVVKDFRGPAKGDRDIYGGSWGDIGYQSMSPLRDNPSNSCEFLVLPEGLEIPLVILGREGRGERPSRGVAAIGRRWRGPRAVKILSRTPNRALDMSYGRPLWRKLRRCRWPHSSPSQTNGCASPSTARQLAIR